MPQRQKPLRVEGFQMEGTRRAKCPPRRLMNDCLFGDELPRPGEPSGRPMRESNRRIHESVRRHVQVAIGWPCRDRLRALPGFVLAPTCVMAP